MFSKLIFYVIILENNHDFVILIETLRILFKISILDKILNNFLEPSAGWFFTIPLTPLFLIFSQKLLNRNLVVIYVFFICKLVY